MDGDEVFALLVCCGLSLWAIVRWYGGLFRVTRLASRFPRWLLLGILPVACVVLVQLALSYGASHEINEEPVYDFLFLAGEGALLGLVTASLPLFGLSARDDAVETHNDAAVTVVCGAWIGVTLCYAGGNIGEGPTIWTTFVPAWAAIATLLVLWLVLESLTRISEAISIDRDMASAVRLAGFLVAAGLVLGRSVAGDWHSWDGTLRDFIAEGWPALPLMVIAAALQPVWRPNPKAPNPPQWTRGWIPALGGVLAASSYVVFLGRPEHVTAGR